MRYVSLNKTFNLSHSIMIGIITLILGIFLITAVGYVVDRHYIATLEDTYFVARLITLIVVCGALWTAIIGLQTLTKSRPQLIWRSNLNMIYIPAVFTGLAIIIALYNADTTSTNTLAQLPIEDANKVIETIIPLALGIHAAMIFSPPDEPAIEIQLAAQRPIGWILAERYALILATQCLIGICAVGLQRMLFVDVDNGLILFARWLPPAIFLSGIGMFFTIKSRNLTFGVLMTAVLWFITVFFTDFFLPGVMLSYPLNYVHPYLWITHPYLQPEHLPVMDYWLNRSCVIAIGVMFISLTIHSLRDSEAVLLGISAKNTREKE